MSISDFLFEYWWLLFWLLPMLYLYIRQRNKDTALDLTHSENQMILEIGLILLVIYLIQKYIFNNHWYFIIALPILFALYFILINYLLKGNDVYVLESTIQNEKFYDIEEMKIHISPNTSHRLLVMDKAVYDSKKHIGDADFTWWRGSDRIKFCDKFIDEKGIFFHPQLPQFHNVTIHTARNFLLKMKEDIPKLYRDNIMLTWLSGYKTLHQLNVMKKKFPLHLMAIEKEYEYEPFVLVKTIEELFDERFLEAQKIADSGETQTKNFEKIESEINELLKGGKKE